MSVLIDALCAVCGGEQVASVEPATHSENLLDVQVCCESCERIMYSFVDLREMTAVVRSEETKDAGQ